MKCGLICEPHGILNKKENLNLLHPFLLSYLYKYE